MCAPTHSLSIHLGWIRQAPIKSTVLTLVTLVAVAAIIFGSLNTTGTMRIVAQASGGAVLALTVIYAMVKSCVKKTPLDQERAYHKTAAIQPVEETAQASYAQAILFCMNQETKKCVQRELIPHAPWLKNAIVVVINEGIPPNLTTLNTSHELFYIIFSNQLRILNTERPDNLPEDKDLHCIAVTEHNSFQQANYKSFHHFDLCSELGDTGVQFNFATPTERQRAIEGMRTILLRAPA